MENEVLITGAFLVRPFAEGEVGKIPDNGSTE